VFERSIREVCARFEEMGLAAVFQRVRRISVVRQESYHDEDTLTIGLNPRDVRKPFAAFHTRPYLLVHELGHQFALDHLRAADKRALRPLFGDYDRPYRRAPKPRIAGPDYVSRYAMTHPVEDFAETFAVCLWQHWDPEGVGRLLASKSTRCRRKVSAVRRLIDRERGRAGHR
jgi:hypothetical protein